MGWDDPTPGRAPPPRREQASPQVGFELRELFEAGILLFGEVGCLGAERACVVGGAIGRMPGELLRVLEVGCSMARWVLAGLGTQRLSDLSSGV